MYCPWTLYNYINATDLVGGKGNNLIWNSMSSHGTKQNGDERTTYAVADDAKWGRSQCKFFFEPGANWRRPLQVMYYDKYVGAVVCVYYKLYPFVYCPAWWRLRHSGLGCAGVVVCRRLAGLLKHSVLCNYILWLIGLCCCLSQHKLPGYESSNTNTVEKSLYWSVLKCGTAWHLSVFRMQFSSMFWT